MILTFFNRVATFLLEKTRCFMFFIGGLYFFHQRKVGILMYRGVTFFSSEKIIFAIIRPVAIFFS